MYIANESIPTDERRRLYRHGGHIQPDDLEPGMILVSPSGLITAIVAIAPPGETLPEDHYRRAKERWQVLLTHTDRGWGAPISRKRVCRVYRDATGPVYDRLHGRS